MRFRVEHIHRIYTQKKLIQRGRFELHHILQANNTLQQHYFQSVK